MINISQEKCNGCGLCVRDCIIFHNIMLDENKKARKIEHGCNSCYHCVAICPQGAITVNDLELSEMILYILCHILVYPLAVDGSKFKERSPES